MGILKIPESWENWVSLLDDKTFWITKFKKEFRLVISNVTLIIGFEKSLQITAWFDENCA